MKIIPSWLWIALIMFILFELISISREDTETPEPTITTINLAPDTPPPTKKWELHYNVDPELMCLAEAIYHEARGEPVRGRIKVAGVIKNRVKSKKFPDNICDVVHQPSRNPERPAACAFSFTCATSPPTIEEMQRWDDAVVLALDVLAGKYDNVTSATHYVRCDVRVTWLRKLKFINRVGNHCFYV
jgi:spore germination cell wall hydrolase CwlJ-like protein